MSQSIMSMTAHQVRVIKVAQFKETCIKVLFLLFLNTTVWLGGTFLFMHLEGTNEAEHKFGVKKVQRNFVDILWQESQSFDEFEWKSSARQKIMQFEDQIHKAVEAGVSSTSGQNVWSIPNTFVYVFTLATTIGYGHLTPNDANVRLVSLVYALIAIPLLTCLVSQLSSGINTLLNIIALSRISDNSNLYSQDEETFSSKFLLTLMTMFLVSGSLICSLMYQWSLADSVYFIFSTISTVGFGDILPQDSLSYLISGGYVLIGLAIFSLWQESVVLFIDNKLTSLLSREKIATENGKAKHE